MHKTTALLTLATLLALTVSGCAGNQPATAAPATVAPALMSIVGVVQDEQLAGIPGAHVAVRLFNRSATTDAAGGFRFEGLPVSAYLVDANATGFEPETLTAEPRSDTNASLNFVLRKPLGLLPRTELTHLKGIIQCGVEAGIYSGSCDFASVTKQAVFQDTSIFQLPLNQRWKSIVVDVKFDPSAHPGFDGLRLVVSGIDSTHQLNNYTQYGRFHGATPFTARVDINGTYPDGKGPVPSNLTAINLIVYPQGYGWHAVCDPTGMSGCFLGAGAGNDISFDLYVSVFYNKPAPDGYTFLK